MSDVPINRPEDVVVRFVEKWNHRDPDALAALFDEDAEFVNVTGLWWHTRDEIRSAHAYGLTHIFKDSWLQATDVRVKRLSEEIAVVHARMTLTGQTSVGEITAPRPRSNVMSFVVHPTPAGWRCISAHNTDASRDVKRTSLMIMAGCGQSAIATSTDSASCGHRPVRPCGSQITEGISLKESANGVPRKQLI